MHNLRFSLLFASLFLIGSLTSLVNLAYARPGSNSIFASFCEDGGVGCLPRSSLNASTAETSLESFSKKAVNGFVRYWNARVSNTSSSFTSTQIYKYYRLQLKQQQNIDTNSLDALYPQVYEKFRQSLFLKDFVKMANGVRGSTFLITLSIEMSGFPISKLLNILTSKADNKDMGIDLVRLNKIYQQNPPSGSVYALPDFYSIFTAYTFLPVMTEFAEAVASYQRDVIAPSLAKRSAKLVHNGVQYSSILMQPRLAVGDHLIDTNKDLQSLMIQRKEPRSQASPYYTKSAFLLQSLSGEGLLPSDVQTRAYRILAWAALGFGAQFKPFEHERVVLFAESLKLDMFVAKTATDMEQKDKTLLANLYFKALTATAEQSVKYVRRILAKSYTTHLIQLCELANSNPKTTVVLNSVNKALILNPTLLQQARIFQTYYYQRQRSTR